MKKQMIICDGCKQLIEPTPYQKHYLTLADETFEQEGGLQTLARDDPLIEEEHHFHGKDCLIAWAGE